MIQFWDSLLHSWTWGRGRSTNLAAAAAREAWAWLGFRRPRSAGSNSWCRGAGCGSGRRRGLAVGSVPRLRIASPSLPQQLVSGSLALRSAAPCARLSGRGGGAVPAPAEGAALAWAGRRGGVNPGCGARRRYERNRQGKKG